MLILAALVLMLGVMAIALAVMVHVLHQRYAQALPAEPTPLQREVYAIAADISAKTSALQDELELMRKGDRRR